MLTLLTLTVAAVPVVAAGLVVEDALVDPMLDGLLALEVDDGLVALEVDDGFAAELELPMLPCELWLDAVWSEAVPVMPPWLALDEDGFAAAELLDPMLLVPEADALCPADSPEIPP